MKNIWERLFLCFRILKKMRKMTNWRLTKIGKVRTLGKIISSFLISEFLILPYSQNRKVRFKNLGKIFPRFLSFWPGPFDTVNHKILFSKLEYYEIKENQNKLTQLFYLYQTTIQFHWWAKLWTQLNFSWCTTKLSSRSPIIYYLYK